jgi:hypothetical protein
MSDAEQLLENRTTIRPEPSPNPIELRIDRQSLTVLSAFDESVDREFWFHKTPQQRIEQVEILRQLNYGHQSSDRLQRVLEVVEFKCR